MKYLTSKVYLLSISASISALVILTVSVAALGFNGVPGNKSLRGKAISAGGRASTHKTIVVKTVYPDLHSLASSSAVVVVGKPISSQSVLIKNERDIVTDYQFQIDEVVKGQLGSGSVITVRLPGGDVDLGNGFSARVRVGPGHGHMMTHWQRYVLYLRAEPHNFYTFTGGPQGAFQLGQKGVISNDRDRQDDPVVAKYHGMDVTQFLRKVRTSGNR